MSLYAGYYINLDRSAERRAAMEAELARHGLASAYARFPADDGNARGVPNPRNLTDGEIGCFASHARLLKENLGQTKPLHVIEDDVIFAPSAARTMDWALGQGMLDRFDLLYTECSIPLLNDAYKTWKKMYDAAVTRGPDGAIARVAFRAFDMRGAQLATTSSFLVRPESIARLHELFETELSRGPRWPADLFLRALCDEGLIRVGCLFPFVTSVHAAHALRSSTAGGQDIEANTPRPEAPPTPDNLARLSTYLARHSFFVGCDWAFLEDAARKLLPLPPPQDRHAALLAHLLAYSLTDSYAPKIPAPS